MTKDTLMNSLRAGTVALALTAGGFAIHDASAQDATPSVTVEATSTTAPTATVTATKDKDDDKGFDDWGLLGLLGLAGLAGLTRKAPQPVVHDEIERTRTVTQPVTTHTTTTTPTTTVRDNTTTVRDDHNNNNGSRL